MDRNEFANRLQSTVVPEGTPTLDINAMMLPVSEAIVQMMPNSLFRFRSFNDDTLDAFKKDVIYAVTADKFNDPYDTLVRYDLEEIEKGINYMMSPEGLQQLKIWFYNGNDFPDVVKQAFPVGLYDALKDHLLSVEDMGPLTDKIETSRQSMISLIETYFPILSEMTKKFSTIACFTESIRSILMWSHYAQSHEGFALEYNFRKTLEQPIKNVGVYPVIYSDERLDASAYIGWAFLMLMGIRTKIPDVTSCIKVALHKSSVWAYEKEWRLIDSSPRDIYSDKAAAFNYKPAAIYYGRHMSLDNKALLHEIAMEKGVQEYEMYLDYSSSEYEMMYRPYSQ